jgi:hypothetical protein
LQKQLAARLVEGGMGLEPFAFQFGIGAHAAQHLPRAGSGDPGGHLGAALGRRGQRHVERAHRADMDVEIDPVEQGAEQARLIIADTARVLVAVPRRIAGIAAAARVHCSDQLDATCFARKLKKLIGVGRRNVRFTHRRDNSAIQQSTPKQIKNSIELGDSATELDDDLQTVIADNFSKFSQASAIDFYFDVGFPDFREPFGCNRIGVA